MGSLWALFRTIGQGLFCRRRRTLFVHSSRPHRTWYLSSSQLWRHPWWLRSRGRSWGLMQRILLQRILLQRILLQRRAQGRPIYF